MSRCFLVRTSNVRLRQCDGQSWRTEGPQTVGVAANRLQERIRELEANQLSAATRGHELEAKMRAMAAEHKVC